MKKLIQGIIKLQLSYDLILTVLGIILVVFLVLTFLNPGNSIFLIAAFTAAGLINVVNGLKIIRDKRKRSIGMNYIFFGIIIIFAGVIISSLM